MGHLTKSLLPACSLAQLFISIGIVVLGTIWVKIEVFEQKSVFWPCVRSASSLKFIETNWDGTPDKVLATRPLANRCHLFHSASLHKVQFGCRRQLFFLVAPIYLPTFIMKLYTRPCPWHSIKY